MQTETQTHLSWHMTIITNKIILSQKRKRRKRCRTTRNECVLEESWWEQRLAWRNTGWRRGVKTTSSSAGNCRWLQLPALRVSYRRRPVSDTKKTRTDACQ